MAKEMKIKTTVTVYYCDTLLDCMRNLNKDTVI